MPKTEDSGLDARLNYRRSAVVLFALEQALGSYVRENIRDIDELPSSQTKKFEKNGDHLKVHQLVQQTYIGEILDLAIAAADLASDKPHLKRLKSLADSLELYDIRNAVCHPNRRFPDVYWYRMAAIANEPAIGILNLNEVITAFDAAQAGKLETQMPPDDWFKELAFSLPNNLPNQIEHEITGLIGRDKEQKDLLQKLKNKRTKLISLVGPGGTGKTAIALDVLRQIVLDPKTFDWTEEVVFVTAKTEKLTHDGPVPIDNPIESIEDVKQTIFEVLQESNDFEYVPEDFDDLKIALEDRRVLLCLDNLETILRDHAETFEEFESELPHTWRLLVTSRVPVDAAKNLPIDPMKSKAAAFLARDYMFKRGGDSMPFETFEKLAEKANCNPLAIRVTVDSVLNGMEIHEALAVTSSQILEFSYTNLLKSLPQISNRVLECLFATRTNQSRNEICFLLDTDLDEVANGILSLLKTSLITRHSDAEEESYSLSASIRDLLLRNPLDDIARTQVFNRLAEKQRVLDEIKKRQESDPLDRHYLSSETDEVFAHDVFQAFQAIRKRSSKTLLAQHLEVVRSHLNVNRSPVLFRACARLLLDLNDRGGAKGMLEQGYVNDELDSSGRLMLAELHKNDNQLEECLTLGSTLMTEGWFENENVGSANLSRLSKVSWLVAIWQGDAFKIVQEVKDWDAEHRSRPTKGAIFVTAIKRLMEKSNEANQLQAYSKEALQCLDKIFQTHGYVGFVVAESVKLFDEINAKLDADSIGPIADELADFLNRHLSSICNVHLTVNIEERFIQQLIEKTTSHKTTNELKTSKWDKSATDDVLEEYGFIPVEIYSRPKDMFGNHRKYLFAKDDEGIEYHVTERAFNKPDGFDTLELGEKIMILPRRDYTEEGRARPVQDAVGIN